MAVTEPFPLVPAIRMLRNASCGSPSAVHSVRMFAEPELDPELFEAEQSTGWHPNRISGHRGNTKTGIFWF